uniref:Glycosyltransferase family 92 protein n=1 Tax=Percolomonas cosmopolitus TaxID=63605 RepID=A0A7S1KNP7_9EUKA
MPLTTRSKILILILFLFIFNTFVTLFYFFILRHENYEFHESALEEWDRMMKGSQVRTAASERASVPHDAAEIVVGRASPPPPEPKAPSGEAAPFPKPNLYIEHQWHNLSKSLQGKSPSTLQDLLVIVPEPDEHNRGQEYYVYDASQEQMAREKRARREKEFRVNVEKEKVDKELRLGKETNDGEHPEVEEPVSEILHDQYIEIPKNWSPQLKRHNYFVNVLLMSEDKQLDHLTEWLEFHLLQRVDYVALIILPSVNMSRLSDIVHDYQSADILKVFDMKHDVTLNSAFMSAEYYDGVSVAENDLSSSNSRSSSVDNAEDPISTLTTSSFAARPTPVQKVVGSKQRCRHFLKMYQTLTREEFAHCENTAYNFAIWKYQQILPNSWLAFMNPGEYLFMDPYSQHASEGLSGFVEQLALNDFTALKMRYVVYPEQQTSQFALLTEHFTLHYPFSYLSRVKPIVDVSRTSFIGSDFGIYGKYHRVLWNEDYSGDVLGNHYEYASSSSAPEERFGLGSKSTDCEKPIDVSLIQSCSCNRAKYYIPRLKIQLDVDLSQRDRQILYAQSERKSEMQEGRIFAANDHCDASLDPDTTTVSRCTTFNTKDYSNFKQKSKCEGLLWDESLIEHLREIQAKKSKDAHRKK